MITTIPFAGFYNTLHDGQFDDTLEMMFSDHDSGCDRNEKLEWRMLDACDWMKAQAEYAEAYCGELAKKFKIDMKFESMTSPREYNFTTDRVFATISEEEVKRLRAATDEKALRDLARQKFTSRDGFSSHYRPDIDEWPALDEWDHNQLGTLVEAYINQEHGEEFDDWEEYALCGDFSGNGWIDNWITNHTPAVVRDRLFKVSDYLEVRRQRVSTTA